MPRGLAAAVITPLAGSRPTADKRPSDHGSDTRTWWPRPREVLDRPLRRTGPRRPPRRARRHADRMNSGSVRCGSSGASIAACRSRPPSDGAAGTPAATGPAGRRRVCRRPARRPSRVGPATATAWCAAACRGQRGSGSPGSSAEHLQPGAERKAELAGMTGDEVQPAAARGGADHRSPTGRRRRCGRCRPRVSPVRDDGRVDRPAPRRHRRRRRTSEFAGVRPPGDARPQLARRCRRDQLPALVRRTARQQGRQRDVVDVAVPGLTIGEGQLRDLGHLMHELGTARLQIKSVEHEQLLQQHRSLAPRAGLEDRPAAECRH